MRENVFKVSLYSPSKEALAEVPEEDLGRRSHIKRLRNEGTWARNENVCKSIASQGDLSH